MFAFITLEKWFCASPAARGERGWVPSASAAWSAIPFLGRWAQKAQSDGMLHPIAARLQHLPQSSISVIWLDTNSAIKLQSNNNRSVFFIDVACALWDKSPSGSFEFKSRFVLMYLNWKLLLGILKISLWTGCGVLSWKKKKKKKKNSCFLLMWNKKLGKAESVSRLLFLMQDRAAFRSYLTSAEQHQAVFTTLL